MPFISREDWLQVAALCYTFSMVWEDESQKPIAILQRWWWLVHQESQRWMMRLSQWQIADQIKADIWQNVKFVKLTQTLSWFHQILIWTMNSTSKKIHQIQIGIEFRSRTHESESFNQQNVDCLTSMSFLLIRIVQMMFWTNSLLEEERSIKSIANTYHLYWNFYSALYWVLSSFLMQNHELREEDQRWV